MYTPEMTATRTETGTTGTSWATASGGWLGAFSFTIAFAASLGANLAQTATSMSGTRAATRWAPTPAFMTWLGTMAGFAAKNAAITALVAEADSINRGTQIPSVVAVSNRVAQAKAIATNFFGINNPLIAALETQYTGEFWPHNAAGMSMYDAVSVAATVPTPVPPPPPLASAAAATAQSTEAAAQSGARAAVSSAALKSIESGAQAGTQGASQSTSQGSNGLGSQASGLMGQASSAASAPASLVSSLGSTLTQPLSGVGQLLSAPASMFGSGFGGMQDLLNGGSTQGAFTPTGALGSPGAGLGGGAGLGSGAGAGGGGGMGLGGGGLGSAGGGLSQAGSSHTSTSPTKTTALSGVPAPTQGNAASATRGGGGGMPMSPMHGAHGGEGSKKRSPVVATAAVATPAVRERVDSADPRFA